MFRFASRCLRDYARCPNALRSHAGRHDAGSRRRLGARWRGATSRRGRSNACWTDAGDERGGRERGLGASSESGAVFKFTGKVSVLFMNRLKLKAARAYYIYKFIAFSGSQI